MIKSVYQYDEVRVVVSRMFIPKSKTNISIKDLEYIIVRSQQSPNEVVKLFGLFLYLLFITAQRNETIRLI